MKKKRAAWRDGERNVSHYFFSLLSSVIRQVCVSGVASEMIEEPQERVRQELVRGRHADAKF